MSACVGSWFGSFARGGRSTADRTAKTVNNARTPAVMVDYLAFGLIAWVAREPGYLRGAGRSDPGGRPGHRRSHRVPGMSARSTLHRIPAHQRSRLLPGPARRVR